MGRRRRLPSDTVHPWALPALSIQMNWDGKPPFIPTNIQATALSTAAGREHRVCLSWQKHVSFTWSRLSHSDKGCFYTTKIKLGISPEESCYKTKSVWYCHYCFFIKPINNQLTFLFQSKVDFLYQSKGSYFLCLVPDLTGTNTVFYGCNIATVWNLNQQPQ